MKSRLRAYLGLPLVLSAFGLTIAAGAAVDAYRQQAQSLARAQVRDMEGFRSPAIYPPVRRAIVVNHGHPAHRQLRCERCHAGTTQSRVVGDRLLPTEASCAPCHDDSTNRERAGASECALCHVLTSEQPLVVATSSYPSARLRFSHESHAGRVRCLTCHEGINEQTQSSTGGVHMPTMETCVSCHHQTSAPTECLACHLDDGQGRMVSRYDEGTLTPPSWMYDAAHDRDFLVRHRWVAADQGPFCATCHAESECEDCHDGRIRMRRVHDNDFLTLHPQALRQNATECSSCHTTSSFCNECHARLGLSTVSAPAIRTRNRFHPPADVWNGHAHGLEARRSMTQCTSCHVERDCVQCHGALGIGAGVSPHPPGFIAECRRAQELNPRACQTCHGGAARCP